MFSAQTYRVQTITFPSGHLSYSVLDGHYRPVPAIDGFLAYLDATDKSPNTIRAHGRGLAWYFTFPTERGVAWEDVGLDDIAQFIA